MAYATIAEIEANSPATRGDDFRQNPSGVIDDAVGRRREHVRDDVTWFEECEKLRQRRHRLAHVNHDGKSERCCDFLRAPKHFEIVRSGYILREPRFDAADDVAVSCDCVTRSRDV